MEKIISVKNLRKTYKKETAVENVCFDLTPGSIMGLLGTNGAGKLRFVQDNNTFSNSRSSKMYSIPMHIEYISLLLGYLRELLTAHVRLYINFFYAFNLVSCISYVQQFSFLKLY